jgi:deoxyuridine 5'-triphosphate nucleotidohydrolase
MATSSDSQYIKGWKRFIYVHYIHSIVQDPYTKIITVPLYDKEIGKYVCKILDGKQQPLRMSFKLDDISKYTDVSSDTLSWEYILGLFDACGVVSKVQTGDVLNVTCTFTLPDCEAAKLVFTDILSFCGVPGEIINDNKNVSLEFHESNCLDVLLPMYAAKPSIYNTHNYRTFKQSIMSDRILQPVQAKVWLSDPAAVFPTKAKPSDVGYDLTVIKKVKDMTSTCALYDTCVRVQCPFGMYAEVVPRSSLSKSGYMLANSVGIIDPSYTGNLMIALVKVDPEAPDIALPFRCCQLIFRKQEFVELHKAEEEQISTARSEGGFGSSGI